MDNFRINIKYCIQKKKEKIVNDCIHFKEIYANISYVVTICVALGNI